MNTKDIEKTVYDIHAFFNDWVGGRVPGDRDTFRRNALDVIADGWVGIFPVGQPAGKKDFDGYMTSLYGTNPEFRIRISDLRVAHERDGIAVVNYKEWQRGAKDSDRASNGRVTTMVLGEKPSGAGIEILQVHETWLPVEMQDAGDYEF